MIGGFIGKPIGGVINAALVTTIVADTGTYVLTGVAAAFSFNADRKSVV